MSFLHKILLLGLVINLLQSAHISDIKAWPIKNTGVGISASFSGEFSSVFLGSIALMLERYLGGSWEIRYKVELRKERTGLPDKVVASCVYKYTIKFPLYSMDDNLTVSLSSSESGILQTATLTPDEAVRAVTNLGQIGNMSYVVLPYCWSSDDAKHSFHIRVKAEMNVPIEVDDRTEWTKSSSFTIPADYCRNTYEERNVVEKIGNVLGYNNPPKTPQCCAINNFTVKVNEYVKISFETYDPDEGDQCYIIIDWGDNKTDRGGWLQATPKWQSTSFSHKYSRSGVFTIKAMAIDEVGKQSDWSKPIIIRVE